MRGVRRATARRSCTLTGEVVAPPQIYLLLVCYLALSEQVLLQVRVCVRVVRRLAFRVHVFENEILAGYLCRLLSFALGKISFKDFKRWFRLITHDILQAFPHWCYVMVIDLCWPGFGLLYAHIWTVRLRRMLALYLCKYTEVLY